MIRHPAPTAPRSAGIAELLSSPAIELARFAPELRRELGIAVAAIAPPRRQGLIRLDSWRLLHEERAQERPFAWSPRLARRRLGLGAARRVAGGTATCPIDGARQEIRRIIELAERESRRPSSLAQFLLEAPRGLRGAVLSSASSYATELLGCLDLPALGDLLRIGAGDPIWAAPGAPWISLRGRRDVELVLDEQLGSRALLCLRSGLPGADAAADLGIVALASALSRPDDPAPARVVGCWPELGRSLSLEVDAAVLEQAASRLVEGVDRIRSTRPEAPEALRSSGEQAAA